MAVSAIERSFSADQDVVASQHDLMEQVDYLSDGTAVSWSQTFFVEDKFDFTLVRRS